MQPIIGETTAIAQARRDYLRTIITPEAGIEFFGLFSRLDLGDLALDTPYVQVIEERATPEQAASRAIVALDRAAGVPARVGDASRRRPSSSRRAS